MENNEVCKQCGRKLVVKATKKSAAQLEKAFYYSAYYYCNYCKKLYHDEKFRIANQQVAGGTLFDEKDHEPRATSHEPAQVDIWTDGACTNNGYPNAKAAWGFVSGETERAGLVEGKQTNNRAEGLAVYHALKWAAEQGYKKVKLHTDSQISLFNLAKPAYKVVANREIFEQIEKVIQDNNLEVTYVKVLGHSGDVNNERADKLANGLATR
jgi:ribonuclease HI